jgi:hypothetical protein
MNSKNVKQGLFGVGFSGRGRGNKRRRQRGVNMAEVLDSHV